MMLSTTFKPKTALVAAHKRCATVAKATKYDEELIKTAVRALAYCTRASAVVALTAQLSPPAVAKSAASAYDRIRNTI
jgi:hypothetical protein